MDGGRSRPAQAVLVLLLALHVAVTVRSHAAATDGIPSPKPAPQADGGHQSQTVIGRAFFVVAPSDEGGKTVLAAPSGEHKGVAAAEELEVAETKGKHSFHKAHHKESDDGKGKGGKHYHKGFFKGHNVKEKKGHHHDHHHGRKTHGDYAHKGADKHGGGGSKGYKGSDHKEKHKAGYKKGDKGVKGKKFGHKGNYHKGHHDKGFKHKEHKDAHGHKHDDQYKKKTGKYGSSYDEEEGYYKKGKGKKHNGGKFAGGHTWDHKGGDSFSIKGKYHEDYSDLKGKYGYDGHEHHEHKKGAKGGHKKGKSHKDGDKYKHKHGDGGGGYKDHKGHHSHTGPVHTAPTYYRVAPGHSPAGGRHPATHHHGSHSTQETVHAPPEKNPDNLQSRQLLLNPHRQRQPRLRQNSLQRPRYVIHPANPLVLHPQYNQPRPQYVLMHPQNALGPHGRPQFIHPLAAPPGHPHPGQTRNHPHNVAPNNPFHSPRVVPRPHHGRPQQSHPSPPHEHDTEEQQPHHKGEPEGQRENGKTSSSYITYGDPNEAPKDDEEQHYNKNEENNDNHDTPPHESRRQPGEYSQPEIQGEHYQEQSPHRGAKDGPYRNSNKGHRGRKQPRKYHKQPPVYKNEIPDNRPPQRQHEEPRHQEGSQPSQRYNRGKRPENNDDIYIIYPNREKQAPQTYRAKEQVRSNAYHKPEPAHRNEDYNLPEEQEAQYPGPAPRHRPRGYSRNSKKRPEESRQEKETNVESHPREEDEGRHRAEDRPRYSSRDNNQYSRPPPRSQSSHSSRPHRPHSKPDHEDGPHDPPVDDRHTNSRHESRSRPGYQHSHENPSSHQEYNRQPRPNHETDSEDEQNDRRNHASSHGRAPDSAPHPRTHQAQDAPQVSVAPHNPFLAPAQTAYRVSPNLALQPTNQKLQPAASGGFNNGHTAFSFDNFGDFGKHFG